MAREKGLLSDLQIRHWIKAGQPLAKTDGNGLTFTLSESGTACWVLRFRFGGRRRELSIGRYPDVGPADARGIATIKRAEVMQGKNPAAEKQKAKISAITQAAAPDADKGRVETVAQRAHAPPEQVNHPHTLGYGCSQRGTVYGEMGIYQQ